jgi:hypothetical protein
MQGTVLDLAGCNKIILLMQPTQKPVATALSYLTPETTVEAHVPASA